MVYAARRLVAPRQRTAFARYAEYVAENLGQGKYWITLNEPTVCVLQGYINGAWPVRNRPGTRLPSPSGTWPALMLPPIGHCIKPPRRLGGLRA
jgi:hypothetical protein